MRIGIVGAGWTGCHLALELAKDGYEVELFEKGNRIFSGVSGDFGIRLHRGPHYPRSERTRESTQNCFSRFCETYPDLVIPHDESIYAHGKSDALGQSSKVSSSLFRSVCHETPQCQEVNPEKLGMEEVNAAFDLDEPSVVIGSRLQEAFARRLVSSSVSVHLSSGVRMIDRENGHLIIRTLSGSSYRADKVVNATGYQSLIPKNLKEDLPLHMEVYYQACLGLIYNDIRPSEKPISRIIMDGWFPCLMPMIMEEGQSVRQYMITHGLHTIMASCRSLTDAEGVLQKLTEDSVEATVKEPTEREMRRFWPGFSERFKYNGWKGVVQAKLKTQSEFRSSLSFEHSDIIYVLPGKISNVFEVYDETKLLLTKEKCIKKNGIQYVDDGVLAKSMGELMKQPRKDEANTGNLKAKL